MTAPAGSLAAEAAQLLDVLAQRLGQLRDRQSGGGDGTSGHPAAGSGAPQAESPPNGADHPGPCPQCGHDPATHVTCSGCPLCATLALLRGERPEAAAKLADGALAIVQVLRGLLAGGGDGPSAPQSDPAEPGRQDGDSAGDQAGDRAGDRAGDATDPVRRSARLVRIDVR